MQSSVFSAAGILCFLLLVITFADSKQHKEATLRHKGLKLKPLSPKVLENYNGLPGEHEYEVDLSDQKTRQKNSGKSVRTEQELVEEEEEKEEEKDKSSLIYSLFQSVINLKMTEDIADKLDDLICTWDKVMGTDFETLVLLLLGWLAFGGVVFLLSHLIYSSMGAGDETKPPLPTPIIPPFKDSAQKSLPKLAVNNNETSDAAGEADRQGRPLALGSDQEVNEYVNKCWDYVYSNKRVKNEIIRLWLEKMNEFTKRSALDDGLYVEFVRLEEGSAPLFTNMTAEPLHTDSMSVTSDLSASFTLKLKTTRPIRDKIEAADFNLVVDKLRARFSLTVIISERLFIAKLDGWPDLKLRVQPVGGVTSTMSREDRNLEELVEEIVTSALRGVQLDIRMDELGGFPSFTRTTKPTPNKVAPAPLSRGGSRPFNFPKSSQSNEDGPVRLLDVKIVKAVQLGGQAGNCLEPYVVLEVDDPSQRHQTRPGTGTQTQWDETFTIEMSSNSSEILLEVWDQGQKIGKSDIFLGLGIVSVSELMVTVSQRHVIPLQGRPYEDDQVTGLLTVEFLFKDGGDSFQDAANMNGVHRTTEMRQTRNSGGSTLYNTKTTYSLYEPPDLLNGADVADIALKELELKQRTGQQPTKTTLLIKSVQKVPRTPSSSGVSGARDSTGEVTDSIGDVSQTSKDSVPMRRGRDKKRNLISTIKKRFSGTTRSLSTSMKGEQTTPVHSRGASLERVRSASEHRPQNGSMSSSYLTIPGLHSEDASSLSDVSGISTASNKTYVTEESSLVLETLEEGRHHHYLIPTQVAKRGRFKKKGVKLHVYLDHIFVARHIKLGTVCSACDTGIRMRLGKQAYVCRDCGITTHKPCHVKVENHCLHTSLPSMELYRGSTILKTERYRGGSNTLKPSKYLSPKGYKRSRSSRQLHIQEQTKPQISKPEQPKTLDPSKDLYRGSPKDTFKNPSQDPSNPSGPQTGTLRPQSQPPAVPKCSLTSNSQSQLSQPSSSQSQSSPDKSSTLAVSSDGQGSGSGEGSSPGPDQEDRPTGRRRQLRLSTLRQLSLNSSIKLSKTIFRKPFR